MGGELPVEIRGAGQQAAQLFPLLRAERVSDRLRDGFGQRGRRLAQQAPRLVGEGHLDAAPVAACRAACDQSRVLQAGDSVGPSSIFSRGTGVATNWIGTSHDGYLGFKMDCSTLASPPASGVCYGYAHLSAVGANGIPTTIIDYCYDKAGNAVTVPGTVVVMST